MFNRETGITNDTAHGVFIDWIVPRNGENAAAVTHHDVLTLIDDFETGLFQCSNSAKMIDARNFRHDYTGTSTSRTFAPLEILTAA